MGKNDVTLAQASSAGMTSDQKVSTAEELTISL